MLILAKILNKTFFITGIAFLLSVSLIAQQPFFYATVATEPYVALSNATSLNSSGWTPNNRFILPIPFPLTLYGEEVENCVFNGSSLVAESAANPNVFFVFFFLSSNLIDAGFPVNYVQDELPPEIFPSASPLRYKTEGNEGERIFKIEVNNSASFSEILSTHTKAMRLTYQLWLFEQNNRVEVRYGPHSITDFNLFFDEGHEENDGETIRKPFFYVLLGKFEVIHDPILEGAALEVRRMELLVGEGLDPQWLSDLTEEQSGLTSYPPEKMVYILSKNINTTSFNSVRTVSLYPNPVTDWLALNRPREFPKMQAYHIINTAGQYVQSGTLDATQQIHVGKLQPGVYWVRIAGEKPIKWIKK
ncbi:T9SS type A sorting domain-containing protein [Flavobacterium sp. JP2137]|uniref:T9SS type A sorting domain-containing protein n=1 Tax=Flavobacterium sp. JP2137 TaxID=3414510 RepID=UPI003D2FA957